MAKFDLESFRDYYTALIKDNLAAKCAQINAEKNDGIEISVFADAAYLMDMNAQVNNFNSYFFSFFDEITTIPNGGYDQAENITFGMLAVFSNNEGGLVAERKLLRYSRAFAEIINENAGRNGYIPDLFVQKIPPVPFQANLKSPVLKAGGIFINGSITS